MKKDSDTPTNTAAHSETVVSIETPKPRHQARLLMLFLIAIIALLSSALYILINKHGLQPTPAEPTPQLQTTLSTLANQQQQLSNDLNSTNQLLQTKQALLQKQLNALTKQVESNLSHEATQNQPWLVKKARYYLELAEINSHWSNNQETSIMLLQEADALLQKIPDERLYEVRQTIAHEIAELKSIPPVDIAGIMAKLDKAQATAAQLVFKPLMRSPSLQTTTDSWHEHWQTSLNLLEKLVIVRHLKPGEAPILTPIYQTVLRERISMDLQEAQWAVLQNNSKVYQQSLKQVIKSIHLSVATNESGNNSHSTNNNAKVRAFLTEIRQLQQVQLTPIKPVLTQSLTELDKLSNNSNSHNSSNIIPIPESKTATPHQGNQLP